MKPFIKSLSIVFSIIIFACLTSCLVPPSKTEYFSKQLQNPSIVTPEVDEEMHGFSVPNTGNQSGGEVTDPRKIDLGRFHALVIGNNDYRSLPVLKTAINDAKTVAKVLQDSYNYNIKLILNGTRHNILSSLDGLRKRLSSKDSLLIYYAGHGYYDEDAKRGYWLPVEAERETSADWISNADITDKLKALKSHHVLVVADSCYSGTLTRGLNIRNKSPGYLQKIFLKRSRTVLTSGGLEPVSDTGGGRHSVFAKEFITVLQENKGIIDGTELFSKIRRPVIVNSNQTPQYSDLRFAGHDGGDFLFKRIK